jgi:hypothetical protein
MEVRRALCVFMTSLLLAGVCQYVAFRDNLQHVTLNRVITKRDPTPIVSYEVEITKQLAYPVMSSLLVRITIPEWFAPNLPYILNTTQAMILWELLFAGINAAIAILVATLLTTT